MSFASTEILSKTKEVREVSPDESVKLLATGKWIATASFQRLNGDDPEMVVVMNRIAD